MVSITIKFLANKHFAIAFLSRSCYTHVMRRLKQILITLTAVVSGFALCGTVRALEWQDEVDVQFTFGAELSITLSGSYSDDIDLAIPNLTPGGASRSNDITITVNTNSGDGYVLSASVGNGTTYKDNNLTGTAGTFASLASNADFTLTSTDFAADYWGYTTTSGDNAKFSGLIYNTDKVLKTTTKPSDGATTLFAIGAKASSGKANGTYSNVVKFTAVSNVVTHTVNVVAGENVASVAIATESGGVATGSFNTGDEISVVAQCVDNTRNYIYEFGGWLKSGDYGTFDNVNSKVATFTVGNDDVTLTAWCNKTDAPL